MKKKHSVSLQCTVTLLESLVLFIDQHLYSDVAAAVFGEGAHRRQKVVVVGGGGVLSSNQTCHCITLPYTFFYPPPSPRILLLRLAVVLLQCFSDPCLPVRSTEHTPSTPIQCLPCYVTCYPTGKVLEGDKAGHLQHGGERKRGRYR